MKIIELLEDLISHYDEKVYYANVQLMNGYTKAWYKEKKQSEKSAGFFRKLLKTAKEDERNSITTGFYKQPCKDGYDAGRYMMCCSNYRCILLLDEERMFITPIFWTPDLGVNVENSHRALMMYARSIDNNGYHDFDYKYRWAGFYTYGRGNGDQEQLTLYGESSDYPHDKYSEIVKNCFLDGRPFFPELLEENDELPF